ncbi:MAG: hypothetical protein H0T97_13350 [Actinobacteria bacterium]|nr:hypothetical protein [Actinomycetota bacterium]
MTRSEGYASRSDPPYLSALVIGLICTMLASAFLSGAWLLLVFIVVAALVLRQG